MQSSSSPNRSGLAALDWAAQAISNGQMEWKPKGNPAVPQSPLGSHGQGAGLGVSGQGQVEWGAQGQRHAQVHSQAQAQAQGDKTGAAQGAEWGVQGGREWAAVGGEGVPHELTNGYRGLAPGQEWLKKAAVGAGGPDWSHQHRLPPSSAPPRNPNQAPPTSPPTSSVAPPPTTGGADHAGPIAPQRTATAVSASSPIRPDGQVSSPTTFQHAQNGSASLAQNGDIHTQPGSTTGTVSAGRTVPSVPSGPRPPLRLPRDPSKVPTVRTLLTRELDTDLYAKMRERAEIRKELERAEEVLRRMAAMGISGGAGLQSQGGASQYQGQGQAAVYPSGNGYGYGGYGGLTYAYTPGQSAQGQSAQQPYGYPGAAKVQSQGHGSQQQGYQAQVPIGGYPDASQLYAATEPGRRDSRGPEYASAGAAGGAQVATTPLYVRRDDRYYAVSCPQCGRADFTNMQGFVNHGRMTHNMTYGSHEEAMRLGGKEVDESEVPIGHPCRKRNTKTPFSIQGVLDRGRKG
ncbi:hypothetical protein M427DRAFT_179729 [Gonapodya prolifera JEL478]|uniref:AHC1-like C2H2 zinc-finger domain-containing protein n=1 Tax=Gonapodya prolifera (strain JEL478) TaxID=1344416 RepID=A0A139AQX8_GONPJ|nr:hypothetical protein M427DRAFT_179729 [Gonapodya prolifera JEL478]|eukprot:KXS18923.1 hypothetical protein M427DRAFT_179729 [Gonapodya prolifera JEL478]